MFAHLLSFMQTIHRTRNIPSESANCDQNNPVWPENGDLADLSVQAISSNRNDDTDRSN
jgi:hypothetical protein